MACSTAVLKSLEHGQICYGGQAVLAGSTANKLSLAAAQQVSTPDCGEHQCLQRCGC